MLRSSPEARKQEFEQVALPNADALYNFALKMTRSRKDAEDLVQDTFLRAFRFFHRFEPGTNCRAWLFRILKNTYINSYRKVKRTPDHVDWGQVEEYYDTVASDDVITGSDVGDDTLHGDGQIADDGIYGLSALIEEIPGSDIGGNDYIEGNGGSDSLRDLLLPPHNTYHFCVDEKTPRPRIDSAVAPTA